MHRTSFWFSSFWDFEFPSIYIFIYLCYYAFLAKRKSRIQKVVVRWGQIHAGCSSYAHFLKTDWLGFVCITLLSLLQESSTLSLRGRIYPLFLHKRREKLYCQSWIGLCEVRVYFTIHGQRLRTVSLSSILFAVFRLCFHHFIFYSHSNRANTWPLCESFYA